MARTVSVFLTANIAGFLAGMSAAQRAALGLSGSLNGQSKGFSLLTKAAAGFGVAAVAGIASAVSRFSEFDATMSAVQAATQASASDMQALGDAAIEAGRSTVFSANEAAQAQVELAKAGVSTADILGGALAGSLDLAAAGQIDVAVAAELGATALNVFNLEGSQMAHVADLLAAGAGKAQGSVLDLGAALNQSALVANQMGLSIEETAGSLAAFASAGLIGSDAGTSFRSALLRLANPTAESAELMDSLGLSFYDAQGQFIGMEAVAGQLQTRLAGLTQEQRNAALATIFGQDAIRAASILYDEGAAGVAEWTAKVNDSGFAAETAATLTDNLRGDVEKLGGAFDALLISAGGNFDAALRASVQTLTDLVDGFSNLDGTGASEFFANVSEGAGHTWQILVNLWESLGPLIEGFLTLTGGAVVGGFIAVGDAVNAVAGFLADNEEIVAALVIAVGVKLVAAFVVAAYQAANTALWVAALNGSSLAFLILQVNSVSTAMIAARAAAAGLATALAPFAAIGFGVAIIAGLTNMGDAAQETRDLIDEVRQSIADADGNVGAFDAITAGLETMNADLDESVAKLHDMQNIDGVWDWFSDGFSFITDGPGAVGDVEEAIADATAEIARMEAAERTLAAGTADVAAMFDITSAAARELADAHGVTLADGLSAAERQILTMYGATTSTTAAEEAATAATEDLSAGLGDVAENAASAATAIDGLTDAFRNALGLSKDFEQSIDDLATAVADLNEADLGPMADAFDQVTGKIDITTQAGRDLDDAMQSVRDSGVAAFTDIAANGDIDTAIDKYNQTRDAIADAGQAAGLSRLQAVAYADSLLGVPSDVLSNIALLGGPEVQTQINDIARSLEGATAEARVIEIKASTDTNQAVLDLAAVTGIPYEALVTLIANSTAAGAQMDDTANPGGQPRTANMTAEADIAAAEAAFLFNTRNRVQVSVTDPETGAAETSFNAVARFRQQETTASANTYSAEVALNTAARDRTSTIYVQTIGAGAGSAALATGGQMDAYQPYLVGEQGPELIFPNKAGYAATAAQTSALRSSGVLAFAGGGSFAPSVPMRTFASSGRLPAPATAGFNGPMKISGTVRLDPASGLLRFVNAVIEESDGRKALNRRSLQRTSQ